MPHVGVAHDPRADGLAVAGDHVEHAGREDVGRELGQAQRRQRRLLGGLEHPTLPAASAGRDLPDRHHQRVVPGRDLADDADRLAADHGRVAAHVLAGRAALEHARGAGEEAQVVRRDGHLVARGRRAACRRSATRARRAPRRSSSIASASSSSSSARSPGVVSSHSGSARLGRLDGAVDVRLRAAAAPRRSSRRSPG